MRNRASVGHSPRSETTRRGSNSSPRFNCEDKPPAMPQLNKARAPRSIMWAAAERARSQPIPATRTSQRLLRNPGASAGSATITPRSTSSVFAGIAIARQGPIRKVQIVTVILEIEHARETRRVESRVVPAAIRMLVAQQPAHTVRGFQAVRLARRDQRQPRPGGLCGAGTRVASGECGIEITVVGFAPAAIFALPRFQPHDRAPDFRRILWHSR